MSELYNLKQLEELSGGDKVFILEIIKVFLSDVPKQLEEINYAYNQNKYKELALKAHKLKPSIDLLNIKDIAEDIRTIEANASKEIKQDDLPKLIGNVESVLNRVINNLKNDFNLL